MPSADILYQNKSDVNHKLNSRIYDVNQLTNIGYCHIFEAVAPEDQAPGGGWIIASSNSLHASVRPENYAAMVWATRAFSQTEALGRYTPVPELESAIRLAAAPGGLHQTTARQPGQRRTVTNR